MTAKRFTLAFMIGGLVGLGLIGSSRTSADSPSRDVTFDRDVAPILFNKCASCHHPGDVGPMSLLSYKDARPWARSIKEKVVNKEMPPWHADPHYGEFTNDRRLSQKDIDTIAAWVDRGAPEGEPKDLPPAPEFYEGWRSGKPDMVLTMPKEYTLSAEGPDEYQFFRIPTNFKQDVWLQSLETRPGNRKIVHHILVFVQPPAKGFMSVVKPTPEFMEQIKKKLVVYQDGSLQRVKPDAPVFDDGCSAPEGGGGVFLDDTNRQSWSNFVTGEAPGSVIPQWPAGTAKKIPAGSTILLQIHYHRAGDGKVETDRSSVGLIFSKQPPDKEINTEAVVNFHFRIPAGDPSHQVTSCFTVKEDAHILSMTPHMHLRGKDMMIKAFYPDGRTETLLNVPAYSFSWQTSYYFAHPVAVPKGTRIECIAHFDNSDKNKFNPDPTKVVRFGDPTYDEMMIGFMEYTRDGQHLAPEMARGQAAAGK